MKTKRLICLLSVLPLLTAFAQNNWSFNEDTQWGGGSYWESAEGYQGSELEAFGDAYISTGGGAVTITVYAYLTQRGGTPQYTTGPTSGSGTYAWVGFWNASSYVYGQAKCSVKDTTNYVSQASVEGTN
jgi:hypothetical protein